MKKGINLFGVCMNPDCKSYPRKVNSLNDHKHLLFYALYVEKEQVHRLFSDSSSADNLKPSGSDCPEMDKNNDRVEILYVYKISRLLYCYY